MFSYLQKQKSAPHGALFALLHPGPNTWQEPSSCLWAIGTESCRRVARVVSTEDPRHVPDSGSPRPVGCEVERWRRRRMLTEGSRLALRELRTRCSPTARAIRSISQCRPGQKSHRAAKRDDGDDVSHPYSPFLVITFPAARAGEPGRTWIGTCPLVIVQQRPSTWRKARRAAGLPPRDLGPISCLRRRTPYRRCRRRAGHLVRDAALRQGRQHPRSRSRPVPRTRRSTLLSIRSPALARRFRLVHRRTHSRIQEPRTHRTQPPPISSP
jgi:hypothetical protein